MKSGTRRVGLLLLVLGALAACDLPPMISDTGYRGTWGRGNDRNVSIVAITEVAGRWYFRWTKRSFDGKFVIDCDWSGRCQETYNGKHAASYTVATRFDAATGVLAVDTVEERIFPEKQTLRYTDVMDVTDGGRTLRNFTTDRDGRHFEGLERPTRTFTKIANSVADPPRAERP